MADAALAAAPILAVLALMLAAGWSAAQAGAAGLAIALTIALVRLGFGAGQPLQPLLGVAAEAGFITATILWILWPALALHHLQQHTGGLASLRAALARLSTRPILQVLLIGWCMALFLEGAAGFGTPVALVAPLLVGLGVPPPQAVVLALLGHAAGVGFGALGTPVAAQSALTGLSGDAIAWRTALLNAAIAGLLMLFFVRTFRATQPAAPAAAVDAQPMPAGRWAAFAVLAFVLPAVAIAGGLGAELPTLGGALLGGLIFAWAARRASRTAADGEAATPSALPLWRALSPYLVLVLLVLATRVVPTLSDALREVVLQWRLWDHFDGRMQPLLHPGTLLLAALSSGALLQTRSLRAVGPALSASARRLLPVALALFAMLCLSRLMLHAGMIATLQTAAVDGIGRAWPLLAPAVGALGSFVTGSATASNVLFTSLQVQTAQALGLSTAWMAAGQGVGAAIGNIVCPHNVVAGAATVGLAGREGEILRQTLLPCLAVLVLAGVLLAVILHQTP
ncbi:MAG: L-lactate permease [Lysobacter sp.]|nr:L-lactate permease [Lysobacter sp.]